jgi:hypothetical protein
MSKKKLAYIKRKAPLLWPQDYTRTDRSIVKFTCNKQKNIQQKTKN